MLKKISSLVLISAIICLVHIKLIVISEELAREGIKNRVFLNLY